MTKCASCNRELQPLETLRVDGKSNGEDVTFFVHRPSEDGRCFRQVVFGSSDTISLISMEVYGKVDIKPEPYRCPICIGPDYYGKLLFKDDEGNLEPVPNCVNEHRDAAGEKVEVGLVPAAGFVEKPRVGNVNLSDRDAVRAAKGL